MIIQNGRDAIMSDSLKYNFFKICEIMPKRISSQIFMVYTKCSSELDMSFEHSEINRVFEID